MELAPCSEVRGGLMPTLSPDPLPMSVALRVPGAMAAVCAGSEGLCLTKVGALPMSVALHASGAMQGRRVGGQ
jgi:hypothetical protein